MINIINEILEDTKIAYKESVLINNNVLEERLLSVLGNVRLLVYELQKAKNISVKNTSKFDQAEVESKAITKVKKRVPLWLRRPYQKNYKILFAYMQLSQNDAYPVLLASLEKKTGLDSREFISHYNQMKSFAEKAHGKIFEEENGKIRLWKPISEFVINLFTNKDKVIIDNLNVLRNKNNNRDSQKLIRDLQSIGYAFFVKYFDLFNSDNISNREIIEILKKDTNYTEHSCKSRTSHAKNIIKNGLAIDALNLIANSSKRTDVNTRLTAQTILNKLLE